MKVSVKELLKNFSRVADQALMQPVVITKNGRDRLVLMNVDHLGSVQAQQATLNDEMQKLPLGPATKP